MLLGISRGSSVRLIGDSFVGLLGGHFEGALFFTGDFGKGCGRRDQAATGKDCNRGEEDANVRTKERGGSG